MGSVNGSCHPDSGICSCKLLVGGDKCDRCQAGASHFDPGNHFGCSKGSQIQIFISLSFSICDKRYWYSYCMCYLRFLYAAPSQQPAPLGFAVSYSSIKLSWHPPDSPNSNRFSYTVIRDGHSVHNIQSSYPFSTCTHISSNFTLCFNSKKSVLSQNVCICLICLKVLNLSKTAVCFPTLITPTGL